VSYEPSQAGPGVILTPDQRIRVFISSTLEELAPPPAGPNRSRRGQRFISWTGG
jgi:hypothetical protein